MTPKAEAPPPPATMPHPEASGLFRAPSVEKPSVPQPMPLPFCHWAVGVGGSVYEPQIGEDGFRASGRRSSTLGKAIIHQQLILAGMGFFYRAGCS
jgi:hypothetical protein